MIVGSALRVAIGDLDGDRTNEIILVDAKELRVVDPSGRARATAKVPGGIQVLVVRDLDGDGRAEILTGWGQTRDHMQTAARVMLYRLSGERLIEESVLTPVTSRNDIVAILPFVDAQPSLLIAYFESKYMVRSVVVRHTTTWETSDLTTLRTATSYARGDLDGDGRPEIIVGRVYNDDKGDGDAFVLAPDGARGAIPTTRGVRELAIADTDGDGRSELFLADGWHQNYGQHARGLLTWIRSFDGAFHSELIENTPGQSSVGRIIPADVDGDGRVELVTLGSNYVRVFDHLADRWEGTTIAGIARDLATGDLDGIPGDEILILAERSEIVGMRAVTSR